VQATLQRMEKGNQGRQRKRKSQMGLINQRYRI
jgi:hypothetical protein